MEELASRSPVIVRGLMGLRARLGSEVGLSGWRNVRQEDSDTFATLTGDEQWIHVDL